MKQSIRHRIESLRLIMRRENLDAFIIPSTDPHMSEYVAPHWKSREWISGFTGSAGTVVITADHAGLWTDSRYFIQASDQLEGTGISLYKEMLPETPTVTEFLIKSLPLGAIVGIDGKVFSAVQAEEIKKTLHTHELELRTNFDPLAEIWNDRPEIPIHPAYIYDIKYAGKTCTEKISEIRKELSIKGCDSTFLSSLDEIAWTLNLRGKDVDYNPVVISFLYIGKNECALFIDDRKLTPEVKKYLTDADVTIRDYDGAEPYLSALGPSTMLLDIHKTNYSILQSISKQCEITRASSPVALLKAIRNTQEMECLREAMRKDGIALVRFLKWLEEAVPSGNETELSIERKLKDFRAVQPLFVGESFHTIAGYGPHGAIVHYGATEETNAKLEARGLLLLDSGAQYLDGTTDITRTIALGELTEEEKTDYTLVLKGHINLAMAKFPVGTRGTQLDVLAHLPLWNQGMNYLHGTGHGIGHFLNVHEGPQSIRINENPVPLYPGMLTSNEPGVYKTDSHGVRTENLILVINDKKGMYGDYYCFETVTLCPICTKGIIKELLSSQEINWLNEYHQKVYDILSPTLNPDEKEWLKNNTAKI